MPLRVKLVYLADFRILFGNEDPSVQTPVALMYLRDFALASPAVAANAQISLHTFTSKADLNDMIADIDPKNTDVIGVSCYFWNIDRSFKLAKKIKNLNPGALILMGGPESEDTTEILRERPYIDICVRGEGEELFTTILENAVNGSPVPSLPGLAQRVDGEIIDTPGRGLVRDIATLPQIYSEKFLANFPPGEIFYHSERGCFCNCKYCTLGPPLRFKDIDLVQQELKRIFATKTITYVNIWDSDLTWDLERFKTIMRTVDQYNVDRKPVSVNYGFLKMDDEILELLGRNVNRIIMGFQSTNPETTRLAGRAIYDLEERQSALERAFRFIDPSRINAQFIFGLPGDNYENLGESMRWAQRIGLVDVWVVQNLALPGTAYRREAQRYGLVYKKKPFYNIEKTETFSRAEMKKAKGVLFWFVGLSRIYKHAQLRALAQQNIFLWDIAAKFPAADLKTIEENLEGGDMYDFTLKVDRVSHIRRLCLTLLQDLARRDADAKTAFDILLPSEQTAAL